MKTNVKFVDWGELKKNHDADKTVVVKENEFIQGVVQNIKTHDVFGYTYKLSVKDIEEDVMIMGNRSLNKQFMGEGLEGKELEMFTPVEVGDEVKITYHGMYKTESGGKGYSLEVEVNR